MMKDRTARPSGGGWTWRPFALLTLLFVAATVGMLAADLYGTQQAYAKLLIAAACPVIEDGVHCFSGNACLAGTLAQRCEAPSGGGSEDFDVCAEPTTQCIFKPLPDGSCCNVHDYCSASDPAKVCLGGQCLSANATLCNGYCTSDAACNASSNAVPVLAAVSNVSATCQNGACVTVAQDVLPFVRCADLLNTTTLAQRRIVACLEERRFAYTYAPPAYYESCVWTYKCSAGVMFATSGKKRALVSEPEARPMRIALRPV